MADPRRPAKTGRLEQVRAEIVACTRCPRLRTYCARVAHDRKAAHRDDVYWGKPVPGFGDPGARLLIVGLAPAAHGGNRTGRTFTGDGSGDFLMSALHRTGFASLPTSRRADDGLELRDAYILAAVRCAPPQNKPLPEEIVRCRPHMAAEIAALPRVRVVVALGKIGHDAYLGYLAGQGYARRPRPAFAHGSRAAIDRGVGAALLLGSYHPSRQNTNTGKLTAEMLEAVFREARRVIESPPEENDGPAAAR
ncbi:MAG TPA: uracil-DNA glycosylase [Polyangia bacterium]|nr:uracil-DNA glycosylase [Polyangia bacterium]